MALRPRALVQVVDCVSRTYAIRNLDDVISDVEKCETPFTAGLQSRSRPVHDWRTLLQEHSSLAFVHVLGQHISEMSFGQAVLALSHPAFYVGTEGYAVWVNTVLPFAGAFQLRGLDVFRR